MGQEGGGRNVDERRNKEAVERITQAERISDVSACRVAVGARRERREESVFLTPALPLLDADAV